MIEARAFEVGRGALCDGAKLLHGGRFPAAAPEAFVAFAKRFREAHGISTFLYHLPPFLYCGLFSDSPPESARAGACLRRFPNRLTCISSLCARDVNRGLHSVDGYLQMVGINPETGLFP